MRQLNNKSCCELAVSSSQASLKKLVRAGQREMMGSPVQGKLAFYLAFLKLLASMLVSAASRALWKRRGIKEDTFLKF